MPCFSQKLTQETLEADLQYYYNISKQKNLSPNDKLYILNRIYNKYKSSNVNLLKLQQEINIVKNELQKQKKIVIHSTQSYHTTELSTQQDRKNLQIISPIEKSEEEKYKISAGDVLFIKVKPAEELSKEVVVTPDGKIVLPLIGTIKVEGLTLKEAEKIIEKNLSIYITNPEVSIVTKFFSKRQVFILGEVKNPGGYQYRENLKLFELISESGGVTQYAGTKNIKIYRGEKKQQVLTVNLEEIFSEPDKDILLQPGDIIEVPRLPKTISVIGEVNYPGSYEWYENIDVIKVLTLARGYTATAKLSSVRVFRETPQGKQIIPVDVNAILSGKLEKNIILQPGDVVYVPRKPLVSAQWFVNTVLPWLTLITTVLFLISYTR
ncbi:MAG: polysaccharide export protein [Endomicrobia bacterium]|nr:polysaccharide export protein [Endomicrobiia bacterium]